MKAAVCYEFGKPLVVEEVEIDPPQAGEMKVRMAATAICHSDIHALRGEWGGQVPVIAGHEAAGVVEEVGEGVTLTKSGDHVVVLLLRSCGRCYYCTTGSPYICEGDFALNKENFETYLANEDSSKIGPFFGWLCTQIAYYNQDMLLLKTRAHFRGHGLRPYIELEPTDHPVAIDQRQGLSLDKAWEIVHFYMDLSL